MELRRILALRADMGRHCELRSSYLLKVCRSYGAWVTRISVIHFSEDVMSVTDFIYICNVSAVGA